MEIKRTSIFDGKIIQVSLDRVVLPNGSECDLEIVRHPGGAAAVAIDEAANVCLLRQYRHAANGWLWELPAGKLEPDESPQLTAYRELEEEAGVEAARWVALGSHISSPGVLTEVIHLFLARDLSMVAQNMEEHELIEVHWLPFDEALLWAANGTIKDGKTLIGLFLARAYLSKE